MPKKCFRSGFVKRPLPWAIVGCNGQRGTVDLVGKMVVTDWKLFRQFTDLVSEVDRFLVDQQFLEGQFRRLHLDSGSWIVILTCCTSFDSATAIFGELHPGPARGTVCSPILLVGAFCTSTGHFGHSCFG